MKSLIKQVYGGWSKLFTSKGGQLEEIKPNTDITEIGLFSEDEKLRLKNALGIEIKNFGLFEEALIHRSYIQVIAEAKSHSNERLEFLGDSVLGMIISEYLFLKNPNLEEGELTKMRSWLVNKKTLAICAQKLQLDKFIKLSYSAEKSLKSGSDSILADCLEAIVAAIFLDNGFQITKNFVINVLVPVMTSKNIMVDTNYKSILLEAVQALGLPAPVYHVISEKGPDHDKEFTVGVYINEQLEGTGTGKSKKKAEQAAAQMAFETKFFNIETKNTE